MADGRIVIDTEIDNSGANKGIDSLNKDLNSVAKNGLKAFAGAITVAGTAIVGLSGATTKVGMTFEAEMSKVQAISGATRDQLTELTNKAVEMGAKTKFSASESAQAFQYMAMAGWKTTDMLNGIEGIMNLAAASGEDLASVSDIVTDALTAFGLQAKDSAHFADVLARASSDSNTNVGLMGYTFKYVAPIAGALKYSIEDTAVAIGLMANAGIKGEQAGTSLRAVLTRLVKPPKQAATALANLGIEATNADGSMKSLNNIIVELRTKFAGLTDSQKASYAASIAGQEAMSGLLAIVNASDSDFNNLTESINNANGSADEMASIMQNNLSGSVEQLGGSLESLALSAYESFKGPLKDAADTATQAIEQLTKSVTNGELNGSIEKLANGFADLLSNVSQFLIVALPVLIDGLGWIMENGSTIAALIAAIGSAILTFKAISSVGTIILAFQELTAILKVAKTATMAQTIAQYGLNKALLVSPYTWIALAVVAVVTALVVLWNTNEGFRNAVIGAWNAILDAGKAVWGWLVTFFAETIPSAFQYALDKILEWGTSITNFFTVTIPGWINFIDEWFKQLPYKIGYALGYVAGAIAKWGFDTYTYFVTNVPLWIESIGTWFYELPGRIGAALLATLINIGTWGINTYNSMKQSAIDSVNEVVNYFATLPDRVWQWLLNAAAKLIAFKNDLGSKARDAGSSMVDNIVNTISSLPGKMLDIGLNIVRGLWDGIIGSKDWLFGKVSGFVDGVIAGFKDGFDINSPSRIMEKLIGVNLIKGVGVGMDVETPNLEKDINDNVANLTAMMQGTVDYETARTTATVAARNQKYLGTDSVDTPDNNKPFPKMPDVHVHLEVEGKEVATAIAPYQDILDDYYKGR